MGKIWLRQSGGKLIHMPVVGDDVNDPDNPLEIPASVLTLNRCYASNVVVDLSSFGLGIVTVEFEPSGRTGSCVQCGMCCGHPSANCPHPPLDCGYILHSQLNWHVCQYLTIDKWNKWGDPNNSECGIWNTLMDVNKGCTLWPQRAEEIEAWWTGCGYSFI